MPEDDLTALYCFHWCIATHHRCSLPRSDYFGNCDDLETPIVYV